MRSALTIGAVVLGLLVVMAVYLGQRSPAPPIPPAAAATAAPGPAVAAPDTKVPSPAPSNIPPAAPAEATSTAAPAATAPTAAATPPVAAPSLQGLRVVPGTDLNAVSTVGASTGDKDHLSADISVWGAGIRRVQLTDYQDAVLSGTSYTVLQEIPVQVGEGKAYHRPFAARYLVINGQMLDVGSVAWTKEAEGAYHLDVVDAQGKPVARVHRRFNVVAGPNSYTLHCAQNVENTGAAPLQVTFSQYGQTDMPPEVASYVGDVRRMAVGYFSPTDDPQRAYVFNDGTFTYRHTVLDELGKRAAPQGVHRDLAPLWPNPKVASNAEMVWLASTNRYFTVVTYLPAQSSAPEAAPAITALQERFPEVGAQVIPVVWHDALTGEVDSRVDHRAALFLLTSRQLDIAPGKQADLSLDIYAGPRKLEVLTSQPYEALGLRNLVVYSLGGPCSFCTFQWLAQVLLKFLKLIHMFVRDWALAIIVLTILVRLLLHPLMKKSQINMTRMGKQMQALQPEIEKLKTKYKDDQTALNKEMMALYRERQINPANMLGCAPMFLQMPIWFALYAMLYFAIELRHQPAFFGIFQMLSGGRWHFLADLSQPDRFLSFGAGFTVPMINWHVDSLNMLPLVLSVVYFLQQQLTMPPAANEQQAQQQKMMRWMSVLFPIFMYKMPSGLTLYMMISSLGGMIDGYIVRQHIKREEAAGTLFKQTPRKPGGFMDRVYDAIERQKDKMTDKDDGRKKNTDDKDDGRKNHRK